MDTQCNDTIDKILDDCPRVKELLLSEHYDDTFDVNELSVYECNILNFMAFTMMAIEVLDFYEKMKGDDVSAYNKDDDGDDDSKRVVDGNRQFFLQNGQAKTNTLKFLDKFIDEYTENSDTHFKENFTRIRDLIVFNRELYQDGLI